MRFQRFLLPVVCLAWGVCGFAQKRPFEQNFGLVATTSHVSGVARLVTDTSSVTANYTLRLMQFGIVYTPRIDLVTGKNVSLSLAAPLLFGISTTGRYRSENFDGAKKDTVTGINGADFAFEFPLVADINFGMHSAEDDDRSRRFGFYIGAGYVYSYTKLLTSVGKTPYDFFDPMIRAGIRMGKSWETRWSIGFTMRGLTSGANRTYGLQLAKEL